MSFSISKIEIRIIDIMYIYVCINTTYLFSIEIRIDCNLISKFVRKISRKISQNKQIIRNIKYPKIK